MKKLYCVFSFAYLLFTTSCNNWLDITPQGQVEAEDLYATTKGCNSAVGGIYYTLSSSSLYGQNLSYGLIDVLAQYYDFSTNTSHNYYQLAQYDYADQSAVGAFGTIWHELYYAVAQCNAFIEYSAPHRDKIGNYELLLGEVYGLRALAHMQLFELFGPVIHTVADLSKPSIAYRTVYNNVSQSFDSGETVLTKAAEDLTQALELLKNDPLRDSETGRRGDMNTSVLDYQDVLNYRGARMNYFCVTGLLARLEMLRKNPDMAYTYATRVMEEAEGIITLIDKANIMNDNVSSDHNYSTEMLGSFYVNNLYELTNPLFGMDGETSESANSSLAIDQNQLDIWRDGIYNRQPDGSTADNRFVYWFKKDDSEGYSVINFTKYHKPEGGVNMDLPYFPEVSIMRISEIYYIACEAQIGKDNTLALKYLNDVRKTRNLDDILGPLDNATLMEYLVREARKDFIGEGRMFFMYKRLFRDIYVRQGVTITADENRFVIPIPDDEYEFAGIEKPSEIK